MKIAPLQCDACGAPVPLTDGEFATCKRCKSSVVIDAAHRELRRAAEAARARRREAEVTLRGLRKGPPRWGRVVYGYVLMPLVIVGVPICFLLSQHEYGWYVREWVVLAGMLPFLVMLFFALVLTTWADPGPYINALGIKLRPAPPRPDALCTGCGACGAPLEVEADALAATCDYCGADSWVREGVGVSLHVKAEDREVANLADLIAADGFRSFDLKMFSIVYPVITVLFCGGLFFALPGRAELEALNYARSVDYEWDLVGGHPGPIVDLAVLGDGLIAVGADGRVQIYRDSEWQLVIGTEALIGEVLGVGASGSRALLVGRGGAAAWFEDGDLERVEVGLRTDLHDVWFGRHQEVAIVGAAGGAAFSDSDGVRWWTKSVEEGPDFVAVWGWSLDELIALGGAQVWTMKEGRWSSEMLFGLPQVVGISGNSRRAYIATAPLGEHDGSPGGSSVNFYARGRDEQEWQIEPLGGTRYSAVAIAGDGVWVVGPDGFVQRSDMAPLRAPGAGDLHAIVNLRGKIVVAGDDGVFKRGR